MFILLFVFPAGVVAQGKIYDDYRFSAGSLGAQFSAQKNTSVKGALLGAVSYLKTNQEFNFKVLNQTVNVRPDIEFLQGGLYGVYYPWARVGTKGKIEKRHWKLVGGVAARFSETYQANATIKEKFFFAGSTLSTEQVGYVQVNIRTLRLQPYVGMGYETFIAESPLGLFFDLGTYYQGKPWVKMKATGTLSDNAQNQQRLQDNLNGYRWFPGLMLGVLWRNN